MNLFLFFYNTNNKQQTILNFNEVPTYILNFIESLNFSKVHNHNLSCINSCKRKNESIHLSSLFLTYIKLYKQHFYLFWSKMLRSVLNSQLILNKLLKCSVKSLRAANTTTTAAASEQKWDLHAAVLLERLPIITQELNDLERKFQTLLWQVEYENCLKSDHELQHERELQQAESLKKGEIQLETEESQSKLTAQDKEDAYTEELKAFQSGHIEPHKHLRDTLYLFVEQQFGKEKLLLLPQGPRQEGETMRQTAERVLNEKCGSNLHAQFYGNAPCGFYKYKYPASLREQSVGAKVFFYRATLQEGQVDEKTTNKYEWLVKSDIDKKVTTNEYKESIFKCLF